MKITLSLFIILLTVDVVPAQNVGVGTASPGANLHVNGTFKVSDGSQGSGKVLTSDAAGMASWQLPPESPSTYYPSVTICCQSWMTKNLDVTTYRNGDPIPKETSNAAWAALTTGAYCYYNNDSTTYAAIYGKMYNWYAVNDPRGLAPEGWHIPSDFEWTTLGSCLGGNNIAGGELKKTGTAQWNPPNDGATNTTNFSGLPGGYRDNENGQFYAIGVTGNFWCSLEYEPVPTNAIFRQLFNANADLIYGINHKNYGFSVRCIRD